ncbi:MAG: hypothetical protein LBP30_07670, partial [Clostridiales Family XIII bacterium]|nr:hypothetical protein [Clostridiales Family XIII bacterium]
MPNKIKTVANRVLFLLMANILLLAVACCFALHKLPPWAVSLALIECASGLMEESADELTLIDLNGDGTPEILA